MLPDNRPGLWSDEYFKDRNAYLREVESQRTEVMNRCTALNRMTELGMLKSYPG